MFLPTSPRPPSGTMRRTPSGMRASVTAVVSGSGGQRCDTPGVVRAAEDGDRLPLALLFAAVAEERDAIGAEPPVDVERRAARWDLERTLVAVEDGEVVGVV